MEAAFNVRRRGRGELTKLEIELCLICQKRTHEETRDASSAGLISVKDASSTRTKFHCDAYIDTIDMLNSNTHVLNDPSKKLIWHKSCYSSFTSKSHLERLKKRYEKNLPASSTSEQEQQAVPRLSRTVIPPVDYKLCIFCQADTGSSDDIRRVMTKSTSSKILKHKDSDYFLSCRLAGVSCLIAAEVCYHTLCYAKFLKSIAAFERSSESFSSPMKQACFRAVMDEVQVGLNRGNVFTVKTLWERYLELLATRSAESELQDDNNTLRWFRNKVKKHFEGKAEFIAQENRADSLLIFPTVSKDRLTAKWRENAGELEAMDTEYKLQKAFKELDIDTQFMKSMYHVGTKIRSELQNVESHSMYDGIDIAHVEKMVPQNLFLLLSIIVGDNESDECREKIFSLAQDVIYVASRGKTLTPKHVGLASTVHHATRSKSLVQLLNAAGHCASYETVEKVDTSIAKSEIERWNANGGVIVPSNLEMGKFTQFAGDNINITVETLDGKGMFNATQYAAFQYGKQENSSTVNGNRVIGKQRCFGPSLPPDFHEILPSGYSKKKRPAPIFPLLDSDWFEPSDECSESTRAKDLAWFLCRNSNPDAQQIPSWTGFNHVVSTFESETTSVGHMPIIPAPADDMNTVYTVLVRCKAISEKLGQTYTVISFDQALYCRAKEVVWSKRDEFENVIVRLGGFHTAMNFMKAIGQHMDSSGLRDVWVESGVYGENTTSHMLIGHAYNKAIRGHKLTYEALWRILWPKFQEWAVQNGKSLDENLLAVVDDVVEKFTTKDEDVTDSFCALVRVTSTVLDLLKEFDESESAHPTFKFWRQYMEMVSILMGFIRADREGNWALHLELFSKMLPWFAIYDHTNYARWGPVYLADMRALPTTAPEVFNEFVAGRFSIKRTEGKFKQVATDQALEHVNRIAKVSGGIVGITHIDSARDRWCLTYNERARISDDTLRLFGQQHDDTNDDWTHRDAGKAGLKRDEEDVRKLMKEFERFQVFSHSTSELMNLSNNDIVPDEITSDILSAEGKGHKLVTEFVKSRLDEQDTDFYSRIAQIKAKTMATMYKTTVQVNKDTVTVVKAERDIFRRLLVVRDSGREVDLGSVLKYELSPVPLALASTNQKLNTTTKADLADILTESIEVKQKLPASSSPTCLLVDGPALIQAIGKPEHARTFQDLGNVFVKNILAKFKSGYPRVDVLFDRYQETSIKDGARANRVGSSQPIRRKIDSGTVKLPHSWSKFMSHTSNKSELAAFISNELKNCSELPSDCELVLGGGFSDIRMVWSSASRDLSHLISTTEEADTRIFLHAKDALACGYQRVVISCRDTDVLVLALGHRSELSPEIWIHSGTSKDPKYIPVHSINLAPSVIDNLMAFHAVTGCDTTSQFSGKGKRTCWKVFLKEPDLLQAIGGSAECSEDARKGAEKFVCHLFGYGNCGSVNEVRLKMFVKGKSSIEALPPTEDALSFHLMRSNYQAFIWKTALTNDTDLPSPDGNGWTVKAGKLTPVLMSLQSVPKSCMALVSCSCKKGCSPTRCGCLKAGFLACTSACNCEGLCQMDEDD